MLEILKAGDRTRPRATFLCIVYFKRYKADILFVYMLHAGFVVKLINDVLLNILIKIAF